MIISAEGDVSVHHCFEAMLISLQEDYRQNTLRQLSRDDIKAGINYVKHYGKYKERTVRVLITALEAPQLYTACFSSNHGIKELAYQLEALGENRTRITYSYDYHPLDIFQKANQFIVGKLFKKSLERQSQAQLAALIQYAKQLQQPSSL
ncbi:TPA: DUF3284 domain-containing protein [Streptococcus pyogenes]|uniref:DUF3284 domain-containing protein n=1 Tax=Streptococcus pyogenes TaxID=1314 RepID=UPI0003A75875|nr:DUF3284 domain-containing protein [Streptococcus pyogenes]HER4677035.1 DUF3284 domain-containing protein [Streptococcus pyogenes NGAS346]HER4710904.1 DUF3284 domain-containing protein [Streptococcus pyogenes NGAS330]QCK48968.1 DUF3284 domain-containing protein [Streptococcus pyogenes]VGR47501.1 Domain of uncharacterised function (DUF3284) [Streptococcus pyogenes]VGS03352.1 Domain of uncharacterised function (DUF3284) [Streptococcus pyogenes]